MIWVTIDVLRHFLLQFDEPFVLTELISPGSDMSTQHAETQYDLLVSEVFPSLGEGVQNLVAVLRVAYGAYNPIKGWDWVKFTTLITLIGLLGIGEGGSVGEGEEVRGEEGD